MRRKPVTREEIYFDGKHIVTLPTDAVEKDGFTARPIRKLWIPLLRALNQKQRRSWRRDEPVRRAFVEDALKARIILKRQRPPPPVQCPEPYSIWTSDCPQCGKTFHRVYRATVRYCSNACAAAALRSGRAAANAVRVKARSEARAAARAARQCARCGTPLTAQRSTMKFCSPRCRIAGHRAQRSRTKSGRNVSVTGNRE
jgi:endogenous inhibitor of DNA gyrase (YacG/DUF329 family)